MRRATPNMSYVPDDSTTSAAKILNRLRKEPAGSLSHCNGDDCHIAKDGTVCYYHPPVNPDTIVFVLFGDVWYEGQIVKSKTEDGRAFKVTVAFKKTKKNPRPETWILNMTVDNFPETWRYSKPSATHRRPHV